jgi:hypothetical protein
VYHMHEESRFDVLCNGLTNKLGLEHLQMDIAMACTCGAVSRQTCTCDDAVFPLPLVAAKAGVTGNAKGRCIGGECFAR